MSRRNGFYCSVPRESSNTASDFLIFIAHCIRVGVLRPGDVLVMDNSTVHWSQEISLLLDAIFEAAEVSVASCIFVSIFAQVEVLFLPKYSPELNPCENVFGMVKTFIRNERGRGHFVHELVRAFQSVTWEKVRASYRSCVQL